MRTTESTHTLISVLIPILLAAAAAAPLCAQTIEVVNMIPASLSNESAQDSEPDLTVNPNDPDEIVASAFTRNPTGATGTAPIYLSNDGGTTWSLNNIVPSNNGMTGDITVSLSRNNVLYAGILSGGTFPRTMQILRSDAYSGPGTMTTLLSRLRPDQPYARAYAPLGGGRVNDDLLWVGNNDLANFLVDPRTARIDQSADAATAPPPAGLASERIERRNPFGQNGPPIRQAIHGNGTVYAAYIQRTARNGSSRFGNIVVVRDDAWGHSATPYADLVDPSDLLPGRLVATGVEWVWSGPRLGQERLGDRLSIAVDPNDSDTVYLAWVDLPAGASGGTATIHVRRSRDGGLTWSADLITVDDAPTPQLAVNIRGDVGLLYQQLVELPVGMRWETHFRQSDDGGATWADFVLADTPASTPSATFLPYLGDYLGLTAVGKDFYGVFSASNIPDLDNFPQGVGYQRMANFSTQQLSDSSGSTVGYSIDPFFFRVTNLAEDLDYYVRDWTDSVVVNDIGLEPSTSPSFHTSSDVWNRRSNNPGGFDANDRPINQTPHDFTQGVNYAFARVHRKDVGSSETVRLHFLKSEFGTGSNYQNAGSALDPTLGFSNTQAVDTMANGYPWVLSATDSTHVCLAVEIETPNDPIIEPSLLGHAPGWPDTDLMVLNDNNKAQRNMGVYPCIQNPGGPFPQDGDITHWAIAHNASVVTRNMVLHYDADPTFRSLFGDPELISVGSAVPSQLPGQVTLPAMAPGESRWIGLRVPLVASVPPGEMATVAFHDLVGEQAVDGFTIGVESPALEEAGARTLALQAGNLSRLGHLQGIPAALAAAQELGSAISGGTIAPTHYVAQVQAHLPAYRGWIGELLLEQPTDPFNLAGRLTHLDRIIAEGGLSPVLTRHCALEHAIDAHLTFADLARGNLADVAQIMRWQADLFATVPFLASFTGAPPLVDASARFARDWSARTVGIDDYPAAIGSLLPILWAADSELGLSQTATLMAIESSLGHPQLLQQAHRNFLLVLEALR